MNTTRSLFSTSLLSSLIGALALSSATVSFAGDTEKCPHKHGGQRIEKMKEELSLTDAQAKKIDAIHQRNMEKRKAEREATRKEIDAILTPEQRKKAEKLREERKAKFKEHHGDMPVPDSE